MRHPYQDPQKLNLPMFDYLYRLWRIFFDISRFRLRPQDLPYSPRFLQFSLGLYTLLNAALAGLTQPWYQALFIGSMQTLLLILLTSALLRLVRYQARLNQTLIALSGTGSLFSLLNLPLGIWLSLTKEGETAPALPVLLLLFLVGWNLSVYAHIFRHTLSTHYFWGFITAFVLSLLSGSILNSLLG